MKKFSTIIGIAALVFLSGCYKFETDPLQDSGIKFVDTKLYSTIQNKFGAVIPKIPDVNGEPSPISEISLNSSSLEVSEQTVLYSYNNKNAWELGMFSMNEEHVFSCNIALIDVKQAILPPTGLDIAIKEEPMNTFAEVTGDKKLYLDYAQKLMAESMKTCIAFPVSKMIPE